MLVVVLKLVVLAMPLLYLDEAPTASLHAYASGGLGGVWVIAGFGLILAIVFLAAATGRSDPATVAGVGLGAGIILVIVAALWAFSVSTADVAAISADDWFRYHRWIVVALAAGPAVTSLWAAVQQDLV